MNIFLFRLSSPSSDSFHTPVPPAPPVGASLPSITGTHNQHQVEVMGWLQISRIHLLCFVMQCVPTLTSATPTPESIFLFSSNHNPLEFEHNQSQRQTSPFCLDGFGLPFFISLDSRLTLCLLLCKKLVGLN